MNPAHCALRWSEIGETSFGNCLYVRTFCSFRDSFDTTPDCHFQDEMEELQEYNSFEEETLNCLFCKRNTDDRIKYGEKLSSEDITAHHFCMVSIFVKFLDFLSRFANEKIATRILSFSVFVYSCVCASEFIAVCEESRFVIGFE